jgi:four helix bundle protein
MHDYHRLVVWQKSHALSVAVVAAMPARSRRHGPLITQIIKSAESVPNNIVEGRAADSDAEFARFLRVSFKSSNELCYQLETAVSRGLIPPKLFKRFRIQIIEIQVLLEAFIRKLQRDDRSGADRAG